MQKSIPVGRGDTEMEMVYPFPYALPTIIIQKEYLRFLFMNKPIKR